ncbi:MAG: peptidoglycan DD-metalloendopeptidase family protein [Fermentimonas sp.]|nr:peptidoglycan DD-metalloendopeptidase family protein [Fermentimonas sp.]
MKIPVLISIYLFFVTSLFSQTEQIENLQRQRQAIQEDIRNTNKLYLDVKKQTTTILDRINLINKQISSRRELIEVQRKEVEALTREEARLQKEIERLQIELKNKQDNYADAIKGMVNQKFNQNKLLFILSGKSFGESLRRMQYLREYSKWQKSQADEIKKQNTEITNKQNAIAKAKVDKLKVLESMQQERQKLESEEQSYQHEVSQVRGKEEQLRKELQNKQRQDNQLNNQIEKLIAEEVARLEREAEAQRLAEAAKRQEAEKRQEAAKRQEADKKANKKEETTEETREVETVREKVVSPSRGVSPSIGASTASTESFNLSKDFASNRGRLPMPVAGTSSVVGNFGTKQHKEWNITTNSNGIDIQAERGADIRSVFDGEVSKVFSFPGSNTCVIVRHGEYYTFYANIFDLFVKQGDKVKTGQSLGRIFTDPDTGVSTMHFQLWQKTSKLNPAPWLSR